MEKKKKNTNKEEETKGLKETHLLVVVIESIPSASITLEIEFRLTPIYKQDFGSKNIGPTSSSSSYPMFQQNLECLHNLYI